jgi:hypothetical protein
MAERDHGIATLPKGHRELGKLGIEKYKRLGMRYRMTMHEMRPPAIEEMTGIAGAEKLWA